MRCARRFTIAERKLLVPNSDWVEVMMTSGPKIGREIAFSQVSCGASRDVAGCSLSEE